MVAPGDGAFSDGRRTPVLLPRTERDRACRTHQTQHAHHAFPTRPVTLTTWLFRSVRGFTELMRLRRAKVDEYAPQIQGVNLRIVFQSTTRLTRAKANPPLRNQLEGRVSCKLGHVPPKHWRSHEKRRERELFIDNLLVRVRFIIVKIRWTGLAPWEFEFSCSCRLTFTFLGITRNSRIKSTDLWEN